ncbi:MAG: hypothetical protein ANABAC_3205 [Anaerolineae bacterium]|jgi:hypothetical protein|nr:MAG: hypothetical protein ANABAC_3205 [Anaerolineae bacterium]
MDPDEEFMMWFPPPLDELEEEEGEPPPRKPSPTEMILWKFFCYIMIFYCIMSGLLFLFKR